MNINKISKEEAIKHLYDLIIEKSQVLNILDSNKNIKIYTDCNFDKNNIIDKFIVLNLNKFSSNIKSIIETLNIIDKNFVYVFESIGSLTNLCIEIIINIIRYLIYVLNKYLKSILICDCEHYEENKNYFNIKELYKKLKSTLNFKYIENFIFRVIQSLTILSTVCVAGFTFMEECYRVFNSKIK